MKAAARDDGAVQPPEPTYGSSLMEQIETLARMAYPDHEGSRTAYVREKVIEQFNWLHKEQEKG